MDSPLEAAGGGAGEAVEVLLVSSPPAAAEEPIVGPAPPTPPPTSDSESSLSHSEPQPQPQPEPSPRDLVAAACTSSILRWVSFLGGDPTRSGVGAPGGSIEGARSWAAESVVVDYRATNQWLSTNPAVPPATTHLEGRDAMVAHLEKLTRTRVLAADILVIDDSRSANEELDITFLSATLVTTATGSFTPWHMVTKATFSTRDGAPQWVSSSAKQVNGYQYNRELGSSLSSGGAWLPQLTAVSESSSRTIREWNEVWYGRQPGSACWPWVQHSHAEKFASFSTFSNVAWAPVYSGNSALSMTASRSPDGFEQVSWLRMERTTLNGGSFADQHFLARTTFDSAGLILVSSSDELTSEEAMQIANRAHAELPPAQSKVHQLTTPAPRPVTQPQSSAQPSPPPIYTSPPSVYPAAATKPVLPSSALAALSSAVSSAVSAISTMSRNEDRSPLIDYKYDSKNAECVNCHLPSQFASCWSCDSWLCASCVERAEGLHHCLTCPVPWTPWDAPFDYTPESQAAATLAAMKGTNLLPNHKALRDSRAVPPKKPPASATYLFALVCYLGMTAMVVYSNVAWLVGANSFSNDTAGYACQTISCCQQFNTCFNGLPASDCTTCAGKCQKPSDTASQVVGFLIAVGLFYSIVLCLSFPDRLQLIHQMRIFFADGFYKRHGLKALVLDLITCLTFDVFVFRRDLSCVSRPPSSQIGWWSQRMVTFRYIVLLFNPAFVLASVVQLFKVNPRQDACYASAADTTNYASSLIVFMLFTLLPRIVSILALWRKTYIKFRCFNFALTECCIWCIPKVPVIDDSSILPDGAPGLLPANLLVGPTNSPRELNHRTMLFAEGQLGDRCLAHSAFLKSHFNSNLRHPDDKTVEASTHFRYLFVPSKARRIFTWLWTCCGSKSVRPTPEKSGAGDSILPAGSASSDAVELDTEAPPSSSVRPSSGCSGWQVRGIVADSAAAQVSPEHGLQEPILPFIEIITHVNGRPCSSGNEELDWKPHLVKNSEAVSLILLLAVSGLSREVHLLPEYGSGAHTPLEQLGLILLFMRSPLEEAMRDALYVRGLVTGGPAHAAGLRIHTHSILAIANTREQLLQPLTQEVMLRTAVEYAASHTMLMLVVIDWPRRYLMQVSVRVTLIGETSTADPLGATLLPEENLVARHLRVKGNGVAPDLAEDLYCLFWKQPKKNTSGLATLTPITLNFDKDLNLDDQDLATSEDLMNNPAHQHHL